jgi:ABC-2 type transport system ATP-binding protein
MSRAGVAVLAGVTKRFGPLVALDRVTFTIGQGEAVALLGPNGAGKSTAIAVLLGLRRPDAGSALLFGADPRSTGARRSVGLTPQEVVFPPTLRVREVIDLVRAHFERPLSVRTLAERFELGAVLERQTGGLSGGERRRLGVALAFAGRPRFVVLDEPTASLDRESRLAVHQAIRAHADEGRALLLTTHHLDEAEALARRVVWIENGSVVSDASITELKAASGLTLVRFAAAPGVHVEGAEREGDRLRLLVNDGGAAVTRLVRDGVPLAGLEVRPLTLEEALAARATGS